MTDLDNLDALAAAAWAEADGVPWLNVLTAHEHPIAAAAFIAACDPATIRDLVAAARALEAMTAERDALAEDEHAAARERDELREALEEIENRAGLADDEDGLLDPAEIEALASAALHREDGAHD